MAIKNINSSYGQYDDKLSAILSSKIGLIQYFVIEVCYLRCG